MLPTRSIPLNPQPLALRAAAAMLLAWFASVAMAPAWAAPLDGSWVYTGDASELAKRQAEVETAAQEFSWLLRGAARGKIDKKALKPQRFLIADEGGTIRITTDDGPERVTDDQGTPIEVKSTIDGKPLSLQRTREGEGILTTVRSKTGQLLLRFKPKGNQMVVAFELTSEKFESTIDYELTYSKQ